MADSELDGILDRFLGQEDAEAKIKRRMQAEREFHQRLREECERVATFGPDRLLVGPGRVHNEDDLFEQWAWEWRALHGWLARAGLSIRLEQLEWGDGGAAAVMLIWLRQAAEPGGLDALARSMRKAATRPVTLPTVLTALRELPDRLFPPGPGTPAPPQPHRAEASGPTQGPARGREDGPIRDDEADLLVRRHLEAYPEATAREVSRAVGIALGRVSRLSAWKSAVGRRKASRTPPKKATRPLTEAMLAARGRTDDPAARMEADEAAWQWLVEQADPTERADLHAKPKDERQKLIELAMEQRADDLARGSP